MKDPVERDDIIKAIDKRICELQNHPTFRRKNADIDLYGVKKLFMSLPSARPKGKWVNIYQLDSDGRMMAQCSNCCKKIYFYGSIPNFCPNCGDDMRGANDETN